MDAFFRNSFAHVDNVIPVIKTITWLLLSGTYTNTRRNSSEPSGTFGTLLHQHALQLSRTLQNLPRPSGTYLLNLRQHTPEPPEIFRNLPPEPLYTGTFRKPPPDHTILHRNSPELSGTRLRNLHHFTPELSGTFRNLPPEPAPATRTGAHRSLSGLKTPLAYTVGNNISFFAGQPPPQHLS